MAVPLKLVIEFIFFSPLFFFLLLILIFDSSVKNWESILGYSVSRIDQNQDLGIQQAFFDLPGGGFIEIVSPTDPEGAVGKAISSRGEGIHTLSMSVDDLEEISKCQM